MGKALGIVAILMVSLGGYGLSQRLSADALSMAIGVLFGVLAGVPTALLMMASGSRRNDEPSDYWRRQAIEAQSYIKQLEVRRQHGVVVLRIPNELVELSAPKRQQVVEGDEWETEIGRT